jgi:hypothetical protein
MLKAKNQKALSGALHKVKEGTVLDICSPASIFVGDAVFCCRLVQIYALVMFDALSLHKQRLIPRALTTPT